MTHGTRASYVKGCKCAECRTANSRYSKLQAYRSAAGISMLVDAEPIKAHVAMLREAGIGRRTIAMRAGVSQTVVDRLVGINTEKPCYRVRPATARRILSVQPGDVARGSILDTTGTSRRLRALVAIGWTQTELARRIGWSVCNLNSVVMARRPSVTVGTARMVAAMYDELSMTPGPSARARTLAARHGWLPPLAWDDEQLDDAGHEPQDMRRKAGRGSGITVEDIEEAREQGYDGDQQVAWRLGVTRDTIAKILSRAAEAVAS
jgi:transcriptional regulator with XRE-family HTH domain